MNKKSTPRTKQIVPTTIYEIPKNGFLPPRSDVVESTIDLVP